MGIFVHRLIFWWHKSNSKIKISFFLLFCFLKHLASQRLPFLKLDPSRSYLRPGESINVDCSSSSGPYARIIWERKNGLELPYNFKVCWKLPWFFFGIFRNFENNVFFCSNKVTNWSSQMLKPKTPVRTHAFAIPMKVNSMPPNTNWILKKHQLVKKCDHQK